MTGLNDTFLGPGRYGLAQLRVGDRIQTGHCDVTLEVIDTFADLTGDRFAIHMDEDAARAMGFRDRVAHGLLVLSLIDGLKNQAAAQFDAVASLGWNWTFSAPVFAGDSLGAVITVEALRPTSNPTCGIATLAFDVTNQHGETVQRGHNSLMMKA